MIRISKNRFLKPTQQILFAIALAFFGIAFSVSAVASMDCSQVMTRKFELPKNKNVIPLLFEKMQSLGATEAVNTERCAAFAGACGLAAITVGIEALDRFYGNTPTPNEILTSEAVRKMELLKLVTQRSNNGLYFLEILGLLQFSLVEHALELKVSLRSEDVREYSDLSLAANEMLLLLTSTGGDGHVVLVMEQRGLIVRAYDPNTSRIEEYQLAMTPTGRVRLVSTSNPIGPSSVLDVLKSVRLSPEPIKSNPLVAKMPGFVDLEAAVENLTRFRWLMDHPEVLSPYAKISPFKSKDDAIRNLNVMIESYKAAQDTLTFDLTRIQSFEKAGLHFHLKLITKDIERRDREIGFFRMLKSMGLIEIPVNEKPAPVLDLPKWDPKLLEARVSATFKSLRTQEITNLDNLMLKILTRDDLAVSVPRAIDAYFRLAVTALEEVQPADAHRLITPYFERLNILLNSPQFVLISREPSNQIFGDSIISKFRTIREARKKFALD